MAPGQKRLKKGAQKQGLFGVIDPDNRLGNGNPLAIGEGLATAASMNMADGMPAYIAIDSGNLKAVAEKARDLHKTSLIVIGGDDDYPLVEKGKVNVGKDKAIAAGEAIDAVVALPTFTPEEKVQKLTDFNDIHVSRGLEAVRRQMTQAVAAHKKFTQQKSKEKIKQQAHEKSRDSALAL